MKKYAVLISGGVNASYNYGRYVNDLSEMYKTLIEKYGYLKSDITVLYADGAAADLDGDGANEVSSGATKANVISTFQNLKNQITANDMLFIFTTNHGGQISTTQPDVKLWLWGDSISDSEFASLITAITFKVCIITMEQCYSGGFIDNLQHPNVIVTTACDWDEVSWACDSEGNFDEFVYYWTAAVRGKKPDGTVVSAYGPDGKVSLKEAFDYAKANDSTNEAPQYYENPTGLGNNWTLGGPITATPACKPIIRDLDPCRLATQIQIPCRPLQKIIVPCRPLIKDICRPLSRIIKPPICASKFKDTATCSIRLTTEPPCTREMVVIDPHEEIIDPEYLKGIIDHSVLAHRDSVNEILSLSEKGSITHEDVASVLDVLAEELENDLNEVIDLANSLRGKGYTHIKRLTKR